MKNLSLEEGMHILNQFRSKRAFDAGYQARLEGKSKDALPPDMHIFSGKWVEGWFAAEIDLAPQPDLVLPGSIWWPQKARTILNAAPEVEESVVC